MTPIAGKSSSYRPHIDGLRAVAVASVVVHHAMPIGFPAGFAGVDLFFVISGFLISSILLADFSRPEANAWGVLRDFYVRRIRRLFPALTVMLVVAAVLGYAVLLPGELRRLGLHTVASAGFCANFFFAAETGYFEAAAESNPLLHLWTLGVEEQFYLMWPPVILAVLRLRLKLLPISMFLVGCSFFWAVLRSGESNGLFYLPQVRLWELFIGALTALAVRRGVFPRPVRAVPAALLSVLAWALIGLGFALISPAQNPPNAWTLLPVIGAALVVGSDGSDWINRKIVAHRLLVWIGLISYPLYLWHWPLLTYARIALEQGDAPGIKLAAVGLSVLLAWVTTRWVEAPLRHGGNARAKVVGLTLALAAIAGIGWYFQRMQGLPQRFPPLIQQLADFNYNPATLWREGTYFLGGAAEGRTFPFDPNEIDPGRPPLVLWGDSHAAALYPGIVSQFGRQYSIVQRTTGNLPPFVGAAITEGSSKAKINGDVLEAIGRIRPAVVVLAANWVNFGWKDVELTVDALQQAGVRRIILVGPVPQWTISLPQQLSNYVRRHPGAAVPDILSTGFRLEPLSIDREMREFAAKRGIMYVSPCEILRRGDGFLVRLGDTPESLVAYDYGHLTAAGSAYVVGGFPPF